MAPVSGAEFGLWFEYWGRNCGTSRLSPDFQISSLFGARRVVAERNERPRPAIEPLRRAQQKAGLIGYVILN